MPKGLDVSRHQGEIDWEKVAAAGYLFAGIRCSIGNYYIDETFEYNYDNSFRVGIIPIPYWVIRFELDSDSQAAKYIEGLNGRKTWMDVCDVELFGGKDKSDRGRKLHYGMRSVEEETHAMGSIYTSAGYWNAQMPSRYLANFNERLLWAASYGADQPYPYLPPSPPFPSLPKIWDDYSMWQQSQRWQIDGVPSRVDLNDMKVKLHSALRSRSKIPLPDGGDVPPPPDPDPTTPPADTKIVKGTFVARIKEEE